MTYGAIPSVPHVFPTVEAGLLFEGRYKPEDKAAKLEPVACLSNDRN